MILELIDRHIQKLIDTQTKDNHKEVTAIIQELVYLKEDVVCECGEATKK